MTDPLAERVSRDEKLRPTDATKIPIPETHTKFCKQSNFWHVQNTSIETGCKGKNLEAEFPVNFRGNMAPRSAALQHPLEPLILQYTTQGFKSSCGKTWTNK